MKYRENEKERKRAVSRVKIICFLEISTNCFRQLISSILFIHIYVCCALRIHSQLYIALDVQFTNRI